MAFGRDREPQAPFDQDAVGNVVEAFPGTEVVPGPSRADVAEVAAPSAVLVKMRSEFRQAFEGLPWIDQGETSARLALEIALGDPTKAGEQLEARSVRNLKLVNKPHTITEIALAESTYGAESAGPDFYALVSAADANGEQLTYSIGGWVPLGQLCAIVKGGRLPWRCMITATPSRQGNPAYRYVDA